MKVVFTVYDRRSNQKVREYEKDFGWYSEFLERAVKNGYRVMDYGTCVWVVGRDSWTSLPNDFQITVKE